MTGGKGGRGAPRPKAVSKSARALLQFPVGRVQRYLKDLRQTSRVSSGAAVYLTAVLEYLAAEVLELSGNVARELKKQRITPRHILLALRSDEEFDSLMLKHKVTVPAGGVPPHIMSVLLTKKSASAHDMDDDDPGSPAPAPAPKKKASAPKAKATTKKSAMAAAAASSSAPAAAERGALKRAATVEQLGTKRLFLGQNLKIVKSNLGKYDKAEAVVHPTNNSFSTSGMVGNELVRYGGAEFQQEINAIRGQRTLQTTECAITKGGGLSAAYVIHCNSPTWQGDHSIDQLKKTIENALKLADDQNLKSVALPSIGSGNNGFPKDDAARAILQAIDSYFQSVMASSLKEVHFVLYDDESLDVYNKVYAHEFPEL